MAETLDQAVVHYGNHLHPGALRAWLAQGPAVFAPDSLALQVCNDPEHPAVPALRDLLKNADGPAVRRGLIGLLGLPTLALAAVAGLRKVVQDGPAELARTLHGQGHLLDLPGVQRGIARGGVPEGFWPPALTKGRGPDEPHPACDALPAWATALPGSPREVLSRLGPLTATGPVERRLDALRRTMQCARPADLPNGARATAPAFRHALQGVLAPLTADPDPRIAALATACLQQDRFAHRPSAPRAGYRFRAPVPPDPHAAQGEPTPPRPSVPRCRRAAARRVAATAFEPLWHAWSRLPAAQRGRAAAAALRLDPTARERLRSATTAHDGAVRARAGEILDTLPTDSGPPAPLAGRILQGAAS